MKTTDFAAFLGKYLLSYLPGQRGMSDHTISSYETAFSQLISYCQEEHGLPVSKITIESLTPELIGGYLSWLEDKRKNSVSTRNQRLSAIKAFFRFVQRENPRYLSHCQQILQISGKKCPSAQLQYLSYDEVKQMLSKPDASSPKGFRDLVILCLLYDTGARVSELLDLTVGDVRLGKYAKVRLTGKGQKTREVPLSSKTADLLKTYILQKYAPDNYKKITPHILRHTKAMHLLQSGINIVYIRDILGHVDLKTTEIYARADTEMKRKALEQAYPTPVPETVSWQSNSKLMNWLKSLSQ